MALPLTFKYVKENIEYSKKGFWTVLENIFVNNNLDLLGNSFADFPPQFTKYLYKKNFNLDHTA